MPLIRNCIKFQKAGKGGVNNQIYQLFYYYTNENILKKMRLSTGAFLHSLII